MIPIKELLNKVKWDKRENPEDYSVFYLDRVLNRLIEISYKNIKRLDGEFFVINKNEEDTFIPLHRIREVRKKGKLVWQRKGL
ncbi:MAG: DUF504 domain-containing protein [Candidatus Woesearchaeota archaeon]|nr:DUF504 domain-containing protein [Candidatus Woesearchaeota archaeon]